MMCWHAIAYGSAAACAYRSAVTKDGVGEWEDTQTFACVSKKDMAVPGWRGVRRIPVARRSIRPDEQEFPLIVPEPET